MINRLVLLNYFIPVFVVGRLNCLKLALHLVLILNETHDIGLFDISLFSKPFNLSGQSTYSILGGILLSIRFMSFSVHVGFFFNVVSDITFILIYLLLKLTLLALELINISLEFKLIILKLQN